MGTATRYSPKRHGTSALVEQQGSHVPADADLVVGKSGDPGPLACVVLWAIMVLVLHLRWWGVPRTVGPRRSVSGAARDPAQTLGGHAAFRAPCAPTRRLRRLMCPRWPEGATRSPDAGNAPGGGEMTSRRIRRIAGWMLAPLLVAGAVAAQTGAA